MLGARHAARCGAGGREHAALLLEQRGAVRVYPGEGADLDAVFPLWTIRELAAEGVVGELNRRQFAFMGAIHDPGPLIDETAPEVAAKLADDGVDAALLTPS